MTACFPSPALFRRVCRDGLSVVRPLRDDANAHDAFGWNYRSAQAPSYWTYGRLRALTTLHVATQLRPRTVLEVAAGDASLSASLALHIGCKATVNDLLVDHLTRALSLYENKADIKPLPGNLFDMDPAVIGQFDLVTACEVIEHVAHTQAFLEHVKRFVAPGGRLLVTTPNGRYFRNKLPTHSDITDFTALGSGPVQARRRRPPVPIDPVGDPQHCT